MAGDSDAAAVRERQLNRDLYYMDIARAVRGHPHDNSLDRSGAKCLGTKVGAVLVRGGLDGDPLGDRIISTGYNGTPSGYERNCLEGGCIRCSGRDEDSTLQGLSLDICICVHAEQNALLTAARFGTTVAGATLYTTYKPCFTCLKESIQAGVERIVYQQPYQTLDDPDLQKQYEALVALLHERGGSTRFERITGVSDARYVKGDVKKKPDKHQQQPGQI
jgi:dCMP deaminase